MKILLVIDGSSYSVTATEMVGSLHLPISTKVMVMTVVPEHTFLGGITLKKLKGDDSSDKAAQEQKAWELLQRSVEALHKSKLEVNSLVRWGKPAEQILKVADNHGASLIVIGAKGLTDPPEFPLGGVALSVMKHAKCSVLLVKQKDEASKKVSKEKISIKRVLLATDGSGYANTTTQFLLDLPLPQECEVIIITALHSHLESWVMTPTLNFKTNKELLKKLQNDEENEAHKITRKVEKQFKTKGYRTATLVIRGGAAESILAAGKEYKPDFTALGSKGLSGIEHLMIGSVAERVTRFSGCSVLIGR